MTAAAVPGRWWVVPRPNPDAGLRLICFPYAGGNASMCRSWHASLPWDVEVCAAQLPGRANRISEPAFNRLAGLVEAIGAVIEPLCDRPVALFGHSMGAVVAFEVARWLRRHGRPAPVHLLVSGRRAPHLPQTRPPNYLANDEEFIAKLGELNGTPPDLFRHPEILQLLLPTLRSDFQAIETYQYTEEPPLNCPITVFGGRDDEESGGVMLDAWQRHTKVNCSKHLMDGGHFFIHSDEPRLLSLLRLELLRTLHTLRMAPWSRR